MLDRDYAEYAWNQAETLLAIDSPSGFAARAAAWVKDAFSNLGFDARLTVKGGVLVDLGGRMPCCWRLTRIPWAVWLRKSKAMAACA